MRKLTITRANQAFFSCLLKFKLLEVQRQSWDGFTQWAMATPYLMQIRARFFADTPLRPWIEQLCAELVAAGVAKREGRDLLNA
ncbi:hypothetical protein [Polaromonas sp. OV174]|uniref:hypothetical protein n=1 Tax=Polaromonas sp. OV174 TaxID=1855300 RepID=UPI0015A63554|nr:hypothetical protein [Polaromonas sp. OV174]